MKGTIVNYRRGRKTECPNQCVVKVEGVKDRASAEGIVGKKAVWKNDIGTTLVGKVTGAHGNSGAILVRFGKGMPGQAVGKPIEVM